MALVFVHCAGTPVVSAVSTEGSIDGDSTCVGSGGRCATRTHVTDSRDLLRDGSDEEYWPTTQVHAQCADRAD